MKRSYILVILFTFLLYIIFNFNNYISSTYNAMALFIGNIISILVALTIILGNKRIESKIAWSIFVLFVPVVGVLFYIILGVEYSRFAKYDKETLSEKDIGNQFSTSIGEACKTLVYFFWAFSNPFCDPI